MEKKKIRFITTAAVIASLYVALTYVFAGISFESVQFRISEMLTVLPYFTSAAIPGLTLGCIIANIASPLGPIDIVVGASATLLATLLTRILPKWLAPIPPIICNTVIVGIELHFLLNAPLVPTMISVGIGEAIVCILGGYTLMFAINKTGGKIFNPEEYGVRLFRKRK